MRIRTCLSLGLLLVMSSAQTAPDSLQLLLKAINDLNSNVNSMRSDMKTMRADIDELKKQQSGTGGQLSNIETSSKQHWYLLRALALRQIDIQDGMSRSLVYCQEASANQTTLMTKFSKETSRTQEFLGVSNKAIPFTYAGHSYLIFGPKHAKTWTEASKHCKNMPGHMDLVVIDSVEENTKIKQMLGRFPITWFYLGHNDQKTEGQWMDVCGRPLTYFNWEEDEPNNHNDYEHCMFLRAESKWHDVNCGYSFPFVCETVSC